MSYKKIKATLEESLVEFFDYELHEDDFGVGITREIGQGEKPMLITNQTLMAATSFSLRRRATKIDSPLTILIQH